MILDYNRKPDATVDEKVQSLMESTQLALNDIARAQDTADVAKEDAQTSIALSQTARQAANEASESAARAKEAADEATEAVEEIEGDVSGLKTRVTQAEADIDAAESDISALGTRVGTAEGKITTIEGDVTSLEGDVTSLSGRVTQAESDIDSVEGDITTLQGDVSTAQGDITTIQGNITNLTGRVADAESDITAVEGDITSLQGRVSDAEDDVEDVMKGLALAEDVVGTLTWITAHSTVTTDTTPQQGTVYYIKHLDGTYEAVTDTTGKNPAQEGWYVLDEALQNYVLSHLSLQNDGLYVMKDGSHWKVKIDNNGVYILDPNNDPANQMTGSGNIIGYDEETHAEIDYHSMELIDKEGDTYFWVSDLRNREGYLTRTEVFTADGMQYGWTVEFPISELVSATDSLNPNNTARVYGEQGVIFSIRPETGAIITVVYKTTSNLAKAYTLGKRNSEDEVGALSVAEGYNTTASGSYSHAEGNGTNATGFISHTEGIYTTASGNYSHAEGNDTTASGPDSHAEGYGTRASGYYSHAEGCGATAYGTSSHAEGHGTIARGMYSHAQNLNTRASRMSQTALGEYNIADTQGSSPADRGKYVVIIGNGTDDNARSNALAVTWGGNVEIALDTTAQSGVDKEIYDALVDLGWDSDIIV